MKIMKFPIHLFPIWADLSSLCSIAKFIVKKDSKKEL